MSIAQFKAAVDRDQHLDVAALLVGAWSQPTDLQPYLRQLDDIATTAQIAIDAVADNPSARARAIAVAIFDQHGFTGNRENYYEEQNSFLTSVLDRKLGIPITLGVLYLEVARRVGVLAQGVNFPGHFLVRVAVDDAWLFLDPFDQGKPLSPRDLQELAKRAMGDDAKVEPRLIQAASKRQILTRMLTNLAGIYGRANDLERSIIVLEHMQVVDPDNERIGKELASLTTKVESLN